MPVKEQPLESKALQIGVQWHQKWLHEAITRECFPGDNIKCSFMDTFGLISCHNGVDFLALGSNLEPRGYLRLRGAS